MEDVSILLYYGGNVLEDPRAGVSYDTKPQGLYMVRKGTTLHEMEVTFMPEVASPTEHVRLKFTCRYPQQHPQGQWKFQALPINNDDTLANILCLPEKFALGFTLEFYVEKENILGGSQFTTSLGGPFTQLLTQGTDNCTYPRMNRDHSNLYLSLITNYIKRQIARSPDLPIPNIIDYVKEKLKFTISYKKAWLARTKAIAMVFGNWEDSYKKLPKYMSALQHFNRGTVVVTSTLPANVPRTVYMNFFFWAFAPAIEGFKYCRPVLCIDATHLYGKYVGRILAAVAVTGNDKIMPVAFAIIREETIESWRWFIINLRRHVVCDREDVTLISDRHSSILNVMNTIWANSSAQPRGHHRYCLRHMCSNFFKKFKNTKMKDLLWRAGAARQVRKHEQYKEQIIQLASTEIERDSLLEWFSDINPMYWALAFDGGRRWGILTTNQVESFNSVLKGAHSVPITASVEVTFYRLVKYFHEGRNRCEAAFHNGKLYSENAAKKIDDGFRKSNLHILVPFDRATGTYEVKTAPRGLRGNKTQTVILRPPSCSCGKFQLYHLPCSHMLAVTADLGENPFPLVAPEYRLEYYKRVFDVQFQPMPHEDFWPEDRSPTLLPLPSRLREPKRGHPNHSCIPNEMDTSRQSEIHHCNVCRMTGHTRRTCPARPC